MRLHIVLSVVVIAACGAPKSSSTTAPSSTLPGASAPASPPGPPGAASVAAAGPREPGSAVAPPCFRPEGEYEYVDVCWLPADAERGRAQRVEMVCAEADANARGGRSFYVYPTTARAGEAQPMQPRSPLAWSGTVRGRRASLAIEVPRRSAALTLDNDTIPLRGVGAQERCEARRRIAGLPPEPIEQACEELSRSCKGVEGGRCAALRDQVKAALAEKSDTLRGSTRGASCP